MENTPNYPSRQGTYWRPLALMEFQLSLSPGARGFLVARLQEAMAITVDGIYGRETAAQIKEFQEMRHLPVTGKAGPEEFRTAALEWPSDFERCMNLVTNFEGTSFGDCNATDIDGAGLTMGIAGFTTKHCEVQMLLAQYFAEFPEQVEEILPRQVRDELVALLASRTPHSGWQWLFFDESGRVRQVWREAIAAMGRDEDMQRLQLAMAYERFWKPALSAAKKLGFKSLRSKCFFLDVAVQNGGWRKQHEKVVARDPAWGSKDELARLAAAARAVARCASARWRDDVLARKMAIAHGRGRVHGRQWDLAVHGIE